MNCMSQMRFSYNAKKIRTIADTQMCINCTQKDTMVTVNMVQLLLVCISMLNSVYAPTSKEGLLPVLLSHGSVIDWLIHWLPLLLTCETTWSQICWYSETLVYFQRNKGNYLFNQCTQHLHMHMHTHSELLAGSSYTGTHVLHNPQYGLSKSDQEDS